MNTMRAGARTALILFTIGVFFTLISVVSGCGGPPTVVRQGVSSIATGLVLLDGPAAEGYQRAHERALTESTTMAEYSTAMSTWNDLETGMRSTYSAILAVDAALNAWDAGGSEEWLGLGACAVVSVQRLVLIATGLGLTLPDQISSGLQMIAGIASAACPGRQQ